MSDNTALNPGTAGDLIATEDMTGLPRQSPAVPQLGAANAGYKIPRSKIAIGDVDQDAGDVTFDRPLPAESRATRQRLEMAQMLEADRDRGMHVQRTRERVSSVFGARGNPDRGAR